MLALVALTGCAEGADPGLGAQRHALRSEAPAQRVALSLQDVVVEQPQVFVRGAWGTSAGEFGKRDEASRPGPMSLTVADDGSLLVLDQVERRVLRFDRQGRAGGVVARVAETTEDLVVRGSKLYALVYESAPSPGYRLDRYDLDGGGGAASGPVSRRPLSRSIQLVTGLFASGDAAAPDVWVETRHDLSTRVVAQGRFLAPGEPGAVRLGRPRRGLGDEHLTALRVGDRAAKVLRVVPERGASLALEVVTQPPLLALHALESDDAGRIYLGLLLGGAAERAARRLLLVADGATRRVLELPAERATDTFRPLAVGRDGTVFFLTSDERGVTILRFAAPAAQAGGAA